MATNLPFDPGSRSWVTQWSLPASCQRAISSRLALFAASFSVMSRTTLAYPPRASRLFGFRCRRAELDGVCHQFFVELDGMDDSAVADLDVGFLN